MMKQSRRAKRMGKRAERARHLPGLNLVALMDIFTILVFFLLVNSSDVQEMPSHKAIKLPESIAETKPDETVLVMVTSEDILLQGERIGSVRDALADRGEVFAPLKAALEAQAARALIKPEDPDMNEVTVLGDKAIPFKLLKKVMKTCSEAGFGQVSLAVMQKAAGG